MAKLLHNDGAWVNLLTKLGMRGRDKRESMEIGSAKYFDDSFLSQLWVANGLGKKIVKIPVDDMVRNWIHLENDKDGKVSDEMERISLEQKVWEALVWARLYRGAILVMGIQDGGELNTPLRMNAIRGIDWVKVYGANRLTTLTTGDIVDDPASPYFDDIEVFPVTKLNGETIYVHTTRCLVFKGEPAPMDATITSDFKIRYWGMSVIQSIYEQLADLGAVMGGMSNLCQEFGTGKYTLSNLTELLASQDGMNQIYNRMEIINAAKGTLRAVLLGENERYEQTSPSLAGAPDMIDRFMLMLSAVSEIPATRLYGRSPAGQNATGESDEQIYYDRIDSMNKTMLRPKLQRAADIINVYTTKQDKDKPRVIMNKSETTSPKEDVEMRKTQAETDNIYIMNGTLTAEEVAENRFQGSYSHDTTIEGV